MAESTILLLFTLKKKLYAKERVKVSYDFLPPIVVLRESSASQGDGASVPTLLNLQDYPEGCFRKPIYAAKFGKIPWF